MTDRTWRRLCRSPFLALVISRSAYGRSMRALASVVVILPCSNSEVARFARISFWWAGEPPRRAPFFGWGIAVSPYVSGRVRYPGSSGGGDARRRSCGLRKTGALELLGLLVGAVQVLVL